MCEILLIENSCFKLNLNLFKKFENKYTVGAKTLAKFLDWLYALFGMKKTVKLGLYGATNVGKCLAEGEKSSAF